MLHFGAVFLVGLALDWALYSRLTGLLSQHYSSNDGYLTFLFPRVFLTILSLILIGYSTREGRDNAALTVIASLLFAASTLHAVYCFYRGDEIQS